MKLRKEFNYIDGSKIMKSENHCGSCLYASKTGNYYGYCEAFKKSLNRDMIINDLYRCWMCLNAELEKDEVEASIEEQIKQAILDLKTDRSIIIRLGVTEEQINDVIKQYKLEWYTNTNRRLKQAGNIIKLRKQGVNEAQIANDLGVSRTFVKHILRR